MTPEPKAPASDLDAAVGRIGRLARGDRRVEFDTMGCLTGRDQADLRLILDALSSQSQAAEGMAKALEDIYRNSYVGKAGKPVMRSKYCNYPAHLYHAARTALSQYRTLGDRHVD
ncbi:hypothetical protein [Brevundimonas sp. NIBR11]|uniref:hypothetical protein n=1 Tax=Brevundimonas sp. NIBR11 TaxID=3015999 RepID=UPI0022F0F313|nr:hypothetical protein [Brevundimonas sp. NIBR11]WGM31457.1 hypothetical protein KKHFBJBL_01704 [Brevundimonas sp. NIBR11]